MSDLTTDDVFHNFKTAMWMGAGVLVALFAVIALAQADVLPESIDISQPFFIMFLAGLVALTFGQLVAEEMLD